jgi:hypothetical protein
MVDDERMPLEPYEMLQILRVRFRTLWNFIGVARQDDRPQPVPFDETEKARRVFLRVGKRLKYAVLRLGCSFANLSFFRSLAGTLGTHTNVLSK